MMAARRLAAVAMTLGTVAVLALTGCGRCGDGGVEVAGAVQGDDSVALRLTLRERTPRGAVTHRQQVVRMQVGHNDVVVTLDSDEETDAATQRAVLQAGMTRLVEAARRGSR